MCDAENIVFICVAIASLLSAAVFVCLGEK